MNDALTVQPRREPAGLRPSDNIKAAFGPFCANVRRLKCLTPTQKEIAVLVGKATLKRGFAFLYLGSLSEFTQVRPKAEPFAGLGKNDLSPGLAALAGFGIVKLSERDALEAGACPVTVLTVFADLRQWHVRASDWAYTPEEEQRLADHWEACFQRFTPALPELGAEPDLQDACASVTLGGNLPPGSNKNSDALPAGGELSRASSRVFSAAMGDAREVRRGCDGRAVSSVRSGFRNGVDARQPVKTPANAGCVLTSGTPLRLKSEERKGLKINLKLGGEGELKEALLTIELTDDDDKVREAIKAVLGVEAGERDAGKWIVRRWSSRARVHAVFCDVVERLKNAHLPKVSHPGGLAESFWKNFKESFSR